MSAPLPNYALYESLKQAWIANHPEATSLEYQAAIRKIAGECNI